MCDHRSPFPPLATNKLLQFSVLSPRRCWRGSAESDSAPPFLGASALQEGDERARQAADEQEDDRKQDIKQVEFTVYLHILREFWVEIVEKMKGFGGQGGSKGRAGEADEEGSANLQRLLKHFCAT